MTAYRAYAVRPNGNFDGYEALICADDDEAIDRARRLSDNSAIELWSGELHYPGGTQVEVRQRIDWLFSAFSEQDGTITAPSR